MLRGNCVYMRDQSVSPSVKKKDVERITELGPSCLLRNLGTLTLYSQNVSFFIFANSGRNTHTKVKCHVVIKTCWDHKYPQ